jgi:hypothetical protein
MKKKGLAINTLAIMIILLITMLVVITIMMATGKEGSNAVSAFFGALFS